METKKNIFCTYRTALQLFVLRTYVHACGIGFLVQLLDTKLSWMIICNAAIINNVCLMTHLITRKKMLVISVLCFRPVHTGFFRYFF